MGVASFAWLLLVCGYFLRARRNIHVPLMMTGIFTDIALVLYLQLTKRAVQTAVSFTLAPLQQAHVLVSTSAFVLYFPVLYLGWRLYNEPLNKAIRFRHRQIGVAALVLRTCGFVLMFSMWRN